MDARSLLRAKKAEAKIEHPYASYNASGVLRCSICAVPVKQWDAHLLTKQHRTSVAREKAEAAKAAAAAAATSSKSTKRPAEDAINGTGGSDGKRARVNAPGPSGLPEGFFSSGNRPVATDDSDEDEDQEDDERRAGPSTSSAAADPPTAAEPIAPTGDADLDDFFASLDQPNPATNYSLTTASAAGGASGSGGGMGKRKGYKELIPGQASYEAAPVRNVPAEEEEAGEAEPEETEAEKRERLAREEREEIMGRLEEEERAQEDADSRVALLKQRMEALRKKREGRTAGPAKNGTKGVLPKLNGS